jgi:3-hydroxyisobutyrate dehydrogenase
MTQIAMLGLGAMGARMARRFVSAGHEVTAWSRSGVPTSLADLPARFVASPRAAVAEADVVICMVTDDDASKAVWTDPGSGALPALRKDALAIESSTLSLTWVASLAEQVRAAGGRFLDAPVVGSRPQAEAGTLVHLVGGADQDVARARPVLAAVGGALHHLGASPAGAAAKLIVNAMFGVQVALLAELLGFAERAGLPPSPLLAAISGLPVMSPAAKVAGEAMLAGAFAPLFPIALVAKDFGYAASALRGAGAAAPITDCARAVFANAAAHGLGEQNLTAIVKWFRHAAGAPAAGE